MKDAAEVFLAIIDSMKQPFSRKLVIVEAVFVFLVLLIIGFVLVGLLSSRKSSCEGPNGCSPRPNYCVAPGDGWVECGKLDSSHNNTTP